ncbi:hypothetical protein GCM10022408_37820 [Hymenobacter fastidiosus]|uniref:Uncharacterized protein n=1 Tax=Hymenobacter fastidiosus TaxID=486264 RepID=A0ABP7T2Y8_9BACT
MKKACLIIGLTLFVGAGQAFAQDDEELQEVVKEVNKLIVDVEKDDNDSKVADERKKVREHQKVWGNWVRRPSASVPLALTGSRDTAAENSLPIPR